MPADLGQRRRQTTARATAAALDRSAELFELHADRVAAAGGQRAAAIGRQHAVRAREAAEMVRSNLVAEGLS